MVIFFKAVVQIMVTAQPTDIPVMTRSQSLFILSVKDSVEVCDELLLVVLFVWGLEGLA